MITEKVRDFILLCPEISGRKMNVNCLGISPGSLTLDNVVAEPVVKEYCDGETLRQAVFALGVRELYDENIGGNLEVTKLLENVESWISRQNTIKNLPDLGRQDMMCRCIEVTKSGHLYDTSMSSGRWQMEFRIVYRQK